MLLNDQQYGSRPRRTTVDALLLSRMEKDIIRQTKTNSAHMDNDATGCYDRILISIGMMACRRMGVPSETIRCQAATLQHMSSSVKHAFGISEDSYSGTPESPLFGTGQGSGASPAIWLSILVVLLNALEEVSNQQMIPGIHLRDPWSEIHETWRVGAFVDDTNQGTTDASGSLTENELVKNLNNVAQIWERLLTALGGALNLSKCYWTLQTWEWVQSQP